MARRSKPGPERSSPNWALLLWSSWVNAKAASKIGIIGGALGAVASSIALRVGFVVWDAGHAEVAPIVFAFGSAALLLGIGGIVGALTVGTHRVVGLVLVFGSALLGFFCIWTFWVPAGILLLVAGVMEAVSGARTGQKSSQLPDGGLRATIGVSSVLGRRGGERQGMVGVALPGVDSTSYLEIVEDEATGGYIMLHLDRTGRALASEWFLLLNEAKESARRRFGVRNGDWRGCGETSISD